MSGIAAIIRFDGKPVSNAEIGRLTHAMAYRGVDGIAHHVQGSVALGHCMLRTTGESLGETQPLANEDGSVVIVLDGFLSHPGELRAELLARGARLRDRSDAELVLRAFETWGPRAPEHVDGEYAFVAWDAKRRAAFCVKDHAGMRPLHYHWDGRRLVVASDIAGVLAAGDFPRNINRGMVAEHLANEWHSLDETLWVGVMRQLPAHVMRVDASGPGLSRYWSPSPGRTHGASDDECAEHYRAVLADSVRRASRTHRPLACELSGGLDSSAIFALAHRDLAAGRLPAPSIRGYSYVFERGRPEDEIEYAQAVANHVGTVTKPVPPYLPELGWFAERGRADRDIAPYPNAAMTVSIGEALIADGCRVSLNGEGGDEFLVGHPFHYAEHLADRNWAGLLRSLGRDLASIGPAATWRTLWRHGISSLAPIAMRRWRRSLRGSSLKGWHGEPYWWLGEDLLAKLRERRAATQARQDEARRHGVSHAYLSSVLEDGFTNYVHDYASRISARVGYERRSPMYSRAFIEFAFALDSEHRIRSGRPKAIHRQAMAGMLPPLVLERTEKADFLFPYDRLLDNDRGGVIGIFPHCSMELVGRDAIEELCRRFSERGPNFVPRHEIWTLFSLGNLLADDLP